MKGKSHIRRPRASGSSYAPGALPTAYGMPTGVKATPRVIVIGELGGKFYPGDPALWAATSGLPTPKVTVQLLPGADDSPDPQGADWEVALDWQKAAEFYSSMTGQPAEIVLVYGPNSGAGFTSVVNWCNGLAGVGAGSWSWGDTEINWADSDRTAYDAAVKASNYPWCAAAGDNDSSDGDSSGTPAMDYPGSSPYVICCGGTSRPVGGGAETVWNDGQGIGTGGGFSTIYSRPSWQPANSQNPTGGRMGPDLAMVADPDTGHDVVSNGQWQVIGGTSAVGPMMAGFLAAANGARLALGLSQISQAGPLVWPLLSCFLDITSGNNGAYDATTGPDPCSGLGRPLAALLGGLIGNTTTPTPTPTPTPAPSPTPIPTGAIEELIFANPVAAGKRVTFTTAVLVPAGTYALVPVSTNVPAIAREEV